MVVREVFNRLLGIHGDSPITPTELLVALHLVDSNKADLKTIIKATSMCLQEKQVIMINLLLFLENLMRYILDFYSGSTSSCAAAINGSDSITYVTYANCYSGFRKLPTVVWFCHEYIAASNFKTGLYDCMIK